MSDLASFLNQTPTAKAWKRIGLGPHHGICLPLWSLRSKKNCGVGDFGDLALLIDWCKSVGFNSIQLLPINDSGEDPSPYNSLSSCALNPIYLDLDALPKAHLDFSLFQPFTGSDRLSYVQVRREKLRWLFKYYETAFPSMQNHPDYLSFLKENSSWLEPYARFMAIKDEYGGKQWKDWPEKNQSYEKCEADPRAIDFHRFIQYHCTRQMQKAKEYADQKGIFLIGDLPVLISPDSADVWSAPHLFDLDHSAGAPPDYYNLDGQKWGFPLLNREEMRKDNFAWWRQRVVRAGQFFHLYRLDHFVGLFRIWSFQPDLPSKGDFFPSDQTLWEARGKEILDAILPASDMLPMAENLGIIPPIVDKTMQSYGICGLLVIRWQRRKETEEKARSFIPYKEYDPLNITSVSTHDAEPLQLWWEKYPADAALFAAFKNWTYQPTLASWQRKEILRDSHQTPTIFHINLLQEYLALFPELVHSNPEDERINVPGIVDPKNWAYRFKPTLEELVLHQGLAASIREILQS